MHSIKDKFHFRCCCFFRHNQCQRGSLETTTALPPHETSTFWHAVVFPRQAVHGEQNHGKKKAVFGDRDTVVRIQHFALLQVEVHDLVKRISDPSNGMPIEELLGAAVSNVISSVTMSVRFQPDNPQFKRFHLNMEEGFRLFGMVAQVAIFPILRFLPSVTATYDRIRQVCIHNSFF